MRGDVRGVDDLYQEVLLDHATKLRNQRRLEQATATGEGHNHLCGDHCKVYLDVVEGVIRDASFEGSGCAILLASASLITLAVIGRTLDEALTLLERFRALLTVEAVSDVDDLAALAGIRDFPKRIKCATLPWHALGEALNSSGR
jgi:nitrogen fixation NifU-like protein